MLLWFCLRLDQPQIIYAEATELILRRSDSHLQWIGDVLYRD